MSFVQTFYWNVCNHTKLNPRYKLRNQTPKLDLLWTVRYALNWWDQETDRQTEMQGGRHTGRQRQVKKKTWSEFTCGSESCFDNTWSLPQRSISNATNPKTPLFVNPNQTNKQPPKTPLSVNPNQTKKQTPKAPLFMNPNKTNVCAELKKAAGHQLIGCRTNNNSSHSETFSIYQQVSFQLMTKKRVFYKHNSCLWNHCPSNDRTSTTDAGTPTGATDRVCPRHDYSQCR